ncbi:FtsQ-type POTRA domain-containing protein [Thalassotalea sp. M1531]|uniref:Cell division protein FtsQ n=1 Tax=Thalassotalea algicola TaxID=2716224 RepID=A0A7Y0LCI2_9GAMM|nr:cell division protein FtsQ/DivIB [Thalassotalea algicola]NMP32049.1 FtsQ-type POTRA domain-containing protein [Thalassotalea algicola]
MTSAAVTKKEQPDLTKVHWSFWAGLVFFFLVVIAMLSVFWNVSKRVSSAETAPVTSVVISGEMPYTQEQDIYSVIEPLNIGNFFKVDVNQVQHQVKQLPWVYSVSVRKQWPNELKIYVVDQAPIARWNGDFFINQYGTAFQASAERVSEPMPEFFGPEGSELVALDNFKSLNKLLEYRRLAIEELVLSERFSWQLTLSDGVQINLGREERVERVQRFMDIYPQIKQYQKENEVIDYIDLRYDTGVAVGWKPAPEKQRV